MKKETVKNDAEISTNPGDLVQEFIIKNNIELKVLPRFIPISESVYGISFQIVADNKK